MKVLFVALAIVAVAFAATADKPLDKPLDKPIVDKENKTDVPVPKPTREARYVYYPSSGLLYDTVVRNYVTYDTYDTVVPSYRYSSGLRYFY